MVSAFLVVMEMKDHWENSYQRQSEHHLTFFSSSTSFSFISFNPCHLFIYFLHQTNKPTLIGVWERLIGCVNELFWIISGQNNCD